MDGGTIAVDDPRAADIRDLLARHLAFANANSAPQDVHALDIGGLLAPEVTFISYRRAHQLLGVGALKQLDDQHAEVKSMHTAELARGQGVGRAVLEQLLAIAHDRGLRRVSLETGAHPPFAPARRLYRSAGFVPCGPFGEYQPGPHTTFMTLWLSPSPGDAGADSQRQPLAGSDVAGRSPAVQKYQG